jgi:hypothetical protein
MAACLHGEQGLWLHGWYLTTHVGAFTCHSKCLLSTGMMCVLLWGCGCHSMQLPVSVSTSAVSAHSCLHAMHGKPVSVSLWLRAPWRFAYLDT